MGTEEETVDRPQGWPHFSRGELACRHCGAVAMDPTFMARLERIRMAFGRAMPISSGFRCPVHDAEVGGKGPHTTGHAADVRISGAAVYELVGLALFEGMIGIGVHQRGDPEGRFLHLDDLAGTRWPRPRVWSY